MNSTKPNNKQMQQGISAADFHKEMAKVIERISKLESNQEAMMGQSGQGWSMGSAQQSKKEQPTGSPQYPKQIQEDIMKLEEMNKTLRDVATQYRSLKERLLQEIDKVLRLNHKLQKDLERMANE
uniref:Uncharacterized protein n=1 Tax=Cuerna arida TaxID=1464854 RepID=A0A1B6FHH7_9HEMI